MTDRELLIAIFQAVGAIAERLTGERLTVHVETEKGWTSINSCCQKEWRPLPRAAPGQTSDTGQAPPSARP
jgi:hypothetical protein